ncbi:hypothetical protein [Cetobacterium somerae]
MNITESQLVNTTREILRRQKEISISELRARLWNTFCPTGEDTKLLKDRNDAAFDQKVRNLVSHRSTNGLEEFANYSSNLLVSKIYGK